MINSIYKLVEHHRYGIKGLRKVFEADRIILFTSMAQSVLTAIFPYTELYISTFIIDALINSKFQAVPKLIVILVTVNLVIGFIIDLLNNVNTYKADKVHRDMIKAIEKKAMELDYEEMEDAGLLQKISDATYVMEHIGGYNVFIMYYRQLAENLIKIIISFIMIAHLGLLGPLGSQSGAIAFVASVPFSFAMIMLVTAANIISSRYISKRSKTYTAKGYNDKMKVERKLNYYTDEVFLNYPMGKDIRLFDMYELVLGSRSKALAESIEFYMKYYYDVARNKETFLGISHAFYTLAAYMIVMFKVLAGAITIGELSKYIGSINLLNKAVTNFIDVNQKISLQTEFIKIFDDFMEIRNTKDSGGQSIKLDGNASYCIEFHNVSFRYKNSGAYTLKNISCKITSNSKTAIVGKNGAGKTTFIKLICRLYEPTEGYISLNGTDIREYSYEEYTALFSVVFQDFNLFSFPISENISANREPDSEKVWESLRMAGLFETISRIPNTIHTNLYKYDEDGINVSGGEAQKIAIARALYKDAPIVILDEPTAALDPISEYEIFSSFDRLVQEKTSIFISHRMGSCRFCDEIFVFDKGVIAEHGRHEELVQLEDGVYASLYYAQADYYVKGKN